MSTPTLGGPSNGHLSPGDELDISFAVETIPDDSDASGIQDTPADNPSPSPSEEDHDVINDDNDDGHKSQSDQSSEDNASEDGDFDMEESLPSQHEDPEDEHASSSSSSRAPKRKAPVGEDEYIKANPELYGLRRSVRHKKLFTASKRS